MGWISTEKQLPNYDEPVLIFENSIWGKGVKVAKLVKDEVRDNNKKPYSWKADGGPNQWFGQDASYWQRLPKPPKEFNEKRVQQMKKIRKFFKQLRCKHIETDLICWQWVYGSLRNKATFIKAECCCRECGKIIRIYRHGKEAQKWAKTLGDNKRIGNIIKDKWFDPTEFFET